MSPAELPVEVFCPECGYDLRGIPEGCCPECGFRYDQQAIRSLNRHWHLNRLVELQYAVALQGVALGILMLFRLMPVHLAVGLSVLGVIEAWAILRLTAWRLDVAAPGGMADVIFSLARSAAFWLTLMLGVLIVVGIVDHDDRFPWVLVLAPGIVFGILAWRRLTSARSLHRDARITLALTRELRRWKRANAVMMALCLAAFVVLR